jgi:hypothetical protein
MPARARCARCRREREAVAFGLCGACYQRRRRAKRGPLFDIYTCMIQRCTNSNHNRYHRYGGRGITIDPRWLGDDGFSNFANDMGPRPPDPEWWDSKKAYWSIDRIDNDGPYSPENCRWASARDQALNREPGYQLRVAA